MSLEEKLQKKYNIRKPERRSDQSIEMYEVQMGIYREQMALAEIEDETNPERKKKLKFMYYKLGIKDFRGV